ncbi:nuclear transport factor 2 family protein [Streptomyces qinglanensis]|uniref:nuclear transport factor 2 family protein n=1 Tax=Streptomyces qinglanensis TaxID=943816 RepID=UPI0037BBBEF0
MPDEERSVRAAVESELRLLEPEVRASPALVAELLHPAFVEFGASGRRWDRVSILGAVAPPAGSSMHRIVTSDMQATLLAPGAVHLTYVSDNRGRRARRSSLWRLTAVGWRLYFHQGTLIDDA